MPGSNKNSNPNRHSTTSSSREESGMQGSQAGSQRGSGMSGGAPTPGSSSKGSQRGGYGNDSGFSRQDVSKTANQSRNVENEQGIGDEDSLIDDSSRKTGGTGDLSGNRGPSSSR